MASIMPVNTPDDNGTRLLRKLFGLEPKEYVVVAWSFAYFFCVLASYYILRPVREEMAIGGGPNTIPWLFFGTFVTLMVIGFSITAGMGIGGHLGYPLTSPTSSAPIIILTVSMANCVHLLVTFFYGLRHGKSRIADNHTIR